MRTFFVWELEVKNPLKTHHMHIVTIAIESLWMAANPILPSQRGEKEK
jgi:hypothetical protein